MRYWLFALASFLLLAPGSAPSTGELQLLVRDSLTGYGLTGTAQTWAADGSSTLKTWNLGSEGLIHLSLPRGAQRLSVTSPGYAPIETQFEVTPGSTLPVTVWLDPLSPPDELRPERLGMMAQQGYALLHGFVTDASTGRPLRDAQLNLRGSSARTDERGYFQLAIPLSPLPPDLPPEQDDLVAERFGHKTLVLKNTLLPEGDTRLVLELEPGAGTEERDHSHKLTMPAEAIERSQLPPEETGVSDARPVWEPSDKGTRGSLAQVFAPPPSIRLGTSCSCAACTGVSVMSLETYVKRGLKDEWIASWLPHSLRAGAIAYRSYGAYHVLHPLRPNYDICNTACCQVNNPGTTSSTELAVNYTPGILLQRGGAIFRAEYSAENNNFNCGASGCINRSCTCGDGNAGSPGANWPCVAESYDSGHSCNGHGRGMCQWGTQRAASQGQLWKWIEDHYYNANGSPAGLRSAFMTSPLDLYYAYPDPPQVFAGDTLALYYSTANYSELPHDQILLGASLYSAATGYISDPANDLKVTLYPGSTDVGRWFTVPSSTPAGSYDLVVALWIDVDEDFVITGADLPLVLYTFPGAVTVQ